MNRLKIIGIFVSGVIAIAITLGLIFYHPASAANTTDQTANTATNPMPGMGRGGGFPGGYSDTDLADALGITVDQLTTARQKAYSSALAQAVEKGLITQAQADELTTNGAAFPFGNRWDSWLSQNGIDFDSLLADALGITVDKLQTAYIQAYNAAVDQAVTDGKLTSEQADLIKGQYALRLNKNFQTSMQTAYTAAVQQAVKDGVITQTQADLILKNANNLGMGGFLDFGGPRGFGDSGGGPGRGHNGPMVGGNTTTNSQTPTTTP